MPARGARLVRDTTGATLVEHVLLAAVLAIGIAGALTSGRTALNAKMTAVSGSVVVSAKCRPDAQVGNVRSPTPLCGAQGSSGTPSGR